MPTLTPTVHERLARCGERVFVDGLVPGAEVTLSVDGNEFTRIATRPTHTFAVPPLKAFAFVKARQDDGSGFSPWSPEIIVEPAEVPTKSEPVLPDEVGACSQCVHVTNLVPGSRVELKLDVGTSPAFPVGDGIANRRGAACVRVDFRRLDGKPGATLRGRMLVCGAAGPEATQVITAEQPLPKPRVRGPLFGCQTVVPVSKLQRGARCLLKSDHPDDLGSICSCGTEAIVTVARPLIAGEQVRAQCLWDADPCHDAGEPSNWVPVIPPDDRIRPTVREALIEGDQVIRVDNQILGATLIIRIRLDETQPPVDYGPRPASAEQEIALNEKLTAGNIVSVVQTMCRVSRESDPVVVHPRPPEVGTPVIVPPLVACARAVQVSNLHPGALVRIFRGSVPIGLAWAGEEHSIAVSTAPALIAGDTITARQRVGDVEGPPSLPVTVQSVAVVRRPRILKPVAVGDTQVWVSGVTPGSHILARVDGVIVGTIDATEPVTRIPVERIDGEAIAVTAKLCSITSEDDRVATIESPCTGREGGVEEAFKSLGGFHVPPTLDGGDFEISLEGQLYLPSIGGESAPQRLPLVVIAHGYWFGADSYKGYDYLAHHLVKWGMVVFSLNMDTVNLLTQGSNTQQYSRAEIILRTIELLLADSDLATRLDSEKIGLIGHSMGGEGVVIAQLLNESENRGHSIVGVVSIAPTRHRSEVVLRGTSYLQILGSWDQLTWSMTGTDSQARFSGFRIYDRAHRPKTHAWIYGLRHNPFNRMWPLTGDYAESDIAHLALPPPDHERLARCLINAFFQVTLRGDTAYAGYMEGTVLPDSLSDLEIYIQHSTEPRVVVDNFGDADEQVPLESQPLDKLTNSQGQPITASPPVNPFEDVEHTSFTNSPHNTKGADLGWSLPQATYRTGSSGSGGRPDGVVGLRIGQFYKDDALNPIASPADAFVVVSDGVHEAAVRLGAVASVPYPDSAPRVLCPMRTVRVPIDAFLAVEPALDIDGIDAVTLRFTARPSGHVLVDDLEIGR